MGSLKTWKMMKNGMKNNENSRIFQMFQFCSILGVFQGNLEASWAVQRRLGDVLGGLRSVLEASWRVSEASWRCLGGVLGHLGHVLGKMSKKCPMRSILGKAKIIKIHVWNATCLSCRFETLLFVIFHVFESQLVKTCIIYSFLFCIDFLLIFCWFQIPRNLKNRAPVQAGALFLQNRCFRFESKISSHKKWWRANKGRRQ